MRRLGWRSANGCAPFPRARSRTLRRGIEKESLRVQADGSLALTPHPTSLGSALTHPHITTDFSESQLELITGVHADADRLPAGAPRDPSGRHPRDRRRAFLGFEHAVQPAGRRGDSARALRHVQRRAGENRLPHGPFVPLRPAHADHLGHSLQLLDCRDRERRLLRADP